MYRLDLRGTPVFKLVEYESSVLGTQIISNIIKTGTH